MRRKVMSARSAIAELFVAGATVAIGGWAVANVPMALTRELIRQGTRLGCVVGNCIGVELVASAGLSDRYVTGLAQVFPYGTFPSLARLREEGGNVAIVDACYLGMAFMAAALGMAHYLLPGPWHSSPYAAESVHWRHVQLPEGTECLAVPAIKPDVALVHCQEADAEGNALFRGAPFHDLWLALASRRVIVQAETIVEDGIFSSSVGVRLPASVVDAVVEAPMGCHPCSSHRYYNHDDLHIRAYFRAASTSEGASEYLQVFVRSADDEGSYQARAREPWAI